MKPLQSEPTASRPYGFSLIELLIAMAIGLVVVGAVGYVFLGSKQSFRTQDAMARMQENARYVFEVISRDIRMAGFNGGCDPSLNNTVLAAPDWYGDLDNAIQGYESAGAAAVGLPAGIAANALNGADAVTVVHADETRQFRLSAHAAGTFTTAANHGLAAGDVGKIMVVCGPSNLANSPAVTFAISAAATDQISTGTGAAAADLTVAPGVTYSLNALLYPIQAATYYLRNNAAGEPSLYREVLTAAGGTTAEELVPGVENMQITYGVDTDAAADNIPNDYQDAGAITNGTGVPPVPGPDPWLRVHSVRISLLMRTLEDGVAPMAQTYTYNGANVTAGDLRLRKVFTHVIDIRTR